MEGKENLWPWYDKEDLHPIHYINFPEYQKIITKRDNWREIFSEYFGDRGIFSAKIQELEPIRNKIAHMRGLSEYEKTRLKMYAIDLKKCIKS
jgi:hypothetical protein